MTLPQSGLRWWQTRQFVALAALASTIPLLWPTIPPLVDLPGHIGRYRVQLDGAGYPWLADWYDFHWSLIGNLGIDLLVIPLAPIFGLELAVKLIVIAIPVLIVTGFLWIAREVHGRIPATALFALPIAYCYPVQFGFVNFALAMGLALNLFALWLRLGRLGRTGYRAGLFVPLSCLLWLCHTFGWGVLGVLAFSAEMIRQHDRMPGRGVQHWIMAWIRAGVGCVPLALPLALMIFWREGDHVTGVTGDWFNWRTKFGWLAMVLRDRWLAFDFASAMILYLILVRGVRDRTIEYSRNLALSAVFLFAVFFLLPRVVFGSAYADMRLAPFALGIAVIALRPKPGVSIRGAKTLALFGLAFFLVRLGGTTASYLIYSRSYDQTLAALDHLPQGARLVSFVGRRCRDDWAYTRLEHVPAIALERRLAFTNDQWSMPGAQLLTTRYAAAGRFAHDPSQVVTDRKCHGEWWRPVDKAVLHFPRHAFDYVWMIEPPKFDPRLAWGMVPVWGNGTSMLYRIDHTVHPPRLNGVSPSR